MIFPSGMNHQERQNGSQGPYLPNGAGCSHAASPTSASGRGRCQTPAPARTMEIHHCCRAAAPKAANPLLQTRGSHTCTSLRNRDLEKAQPGSLLTAWQHFPASQSAAQAPPAGQVFRSNIQTHSSLPPSRAVWAARRGSYHARSTTTQLSQDSTDPCETDGTGKIVALSRFHHVYFVSWPLNVTPGQGRYLCNSLSKHRSYINP